MTRRPSRQLLKEACRVAIASLTEEDWEGTFEANGWIWDLYVRELPEGSKLPAVSVAIRIENDEQEKPTVVIGAFAPGRLTVDEARAFLMEEGIE